MKRLTGPRLYCQLPEGTTVERLTADKGNVYAMCRENKTGRRVSFKIEPDKGKDTGTVTSTLVLP